MSRHRVVSDYTTDGDTSNTNIKVFVRARPPEITEEQPTEAQAKFLEPSGDGRRLSIKDPDPSNKHSEVAFQFDKIIWTGSTQESVFDAVAKPQIDHVLRGYNACCFAYGQTGSGKTYSMFGEEHQMGIVPRAAEYIFQCLAGQASDVAIRCSFLEIYLDSIRDLGKVYAAAVGGANVSQFMKTSDVFNSIAKKRQDPYLARAFSKNIMQETNPVLKDVQAEYKSMNLAIHEDIEGNVFVKDLCVVDVTTVDEVMAIIAMGLRLRATHETKMNLVSSRSHTVFTIQVIQSDSRGSGDATSGMLNLVDLAGSERLKRSESQGQRLKEALHINSSLTCLGKVVMALDPTSDRSHIPYRESKLTRMLQNSLGGNSYTVLLAAIHPNPEYYEECLSTLQFANRCRNVRNNPRVNYVTNADGLEDSARKLKRMQEEISALRQKLAQQGTRMGGALGGELAGGMAVDKEKEATVFSHRVQAILRKLEMGCRVGEHGSLDLDDGRRISSEDVHDAIHNGTLAAAQAMGIDLSQGIAALFGAAGAGGVSSSEAEALRAQNKELLLEVRDLKDRMKDRKIKLDEAERNSKMFEAELNRLRALSTHGEHEHKKAIGDMEKLFQSQEEILRNRQEQELRGVVEQNKRLLAQSGVAVQNLPKALKIHTETVRRREEAREGYESTMKEAFQRHLAELDLGRVQELEAMRQQYEYWLRQKDDVLAEFVAGFNAYRSRKSGHLRSCEKEMAAMLSHIERNDSILKNVESGRYFMQHRHSILPAYNEESSAMPAQGGGATQGRTGVTSVIFPRGQVLSRPGSGRAQQGVGEYLQPASGDPLSRTAPAAMTNGSVAASAATANMTLPAFRPLKDLYPLASRITLKYKKRSDREDAARSEAVDQALFRAKTRGGVGAADSTYIPDMEPELQQYVRELLVSPSKETMRIAGSKVHGHQTSNQSGDQQQASAPAPPPRPKSAAASPASPGRRAQSGAAAELAAAYRADGADFIREDDAYLGGEDGSEDRGALQAEIFLLRKEVSRLQRASDVEKLNTHLVVDALKSDETLQYIRALEQEKEKLHESIRQLSGQLQNMKVANKALSRATMGPTTTMRNKNK